MTLDRKDIITIPKWLVIILVPFILGAMGGLITGSYNVGVKSNQIEINTKRLDVVEKEKADKDTYNKLLDDIHGSLNRIETKLEAHINNK
jgi:hypothetical protein